MTVEILSARPKLRRKVVRGALERCVFAAIGLSLAATSIGALGADLTTGSSRPTTVPSQVMRTGHQSVTLHRVPGQTASWTISPRIPGPSSCSTST
jgi:hypothetical protein